LINVVRELKSVHPCFCRCFLHGKCSVSTCAALSDCAGIRLVGDVAWVRFDLTRLEHGPRSPSTDASACFVNLMCTVKAAAGNSVPAAYFDPRKKV
jgi:hypothetical protein